MWAVGAGVVLTTVGAVALVVRSGGDGRARAAVTHRPSTTSPGTTASPIVTAATVVIRDPRRGSGEPVTFAFGGDVHFEAGLRRALLDDPSGAFLAPIAEILSTADVAMVNLETPVTDRDTPIGGHSYVFRAPRAAFTALQAAGVDVVTMANNHAGDQGTGGITDSLAAAAAEAFPVVGIGEDAAQAFAPWRTEIRGQRIAVLAATDVFDGFVAAAGQPGAAVARPVDRLLAAVRAARADSDTVVVYLHWGEEGTACPTEGQRNLASGLVDAGADIVVGSHAHRVQAAGRLGTAFVAFGLGNFVWYNEAGDSGATGVLRVTATGRDIDGYTWTPARIRNGVPTPLTGDAAARAHADWDERRRCTNLAP